MAGWSVHTGRAITLPLENIDTDQLIPARFMSTPRSEGYGTFLLHDLRKDSEGALVSEMPLNRHPGASVLITRRNFGSGSSREAAVYALVDFGIQAVIAPSFGDIFAGNAVNNGLLPLKLPSETVEKLIADLGDQSAAVTVDLQQGTVQVGSHIAPFALPGKWKQKLVNGWDDIDLTQNLNAQISAFRDQRHAEKSWVWPKAK